MTEGKVVPYDRLKSSSLLPEFFLSGEVVEATEIHFSRINLPSSLSTNASLPGMHERMIPIPHPTTSPRTNSRSNSCASNLRSSEMAQHILPAPFPRNSCAIDSGLFSGGGMILTNLASNNWVLESPTY